MRILHVITSLLTGGAEKLMVDLLPRMKEQGHHVELCVFNGKRTPFFDELARENVKIHTLSDGGNVYNPMNIIKLRKLMNEGWDIVHTHNTASQLFVAIASVCSKKTTLITTEHNTTNRRREKAWYKPIDDWMYSKYARVICISDQAKINHCQHLGQARSQNVCTIYNGIDYSRYANASPADDIRDIGEKIITNVAAFRPQKDQPTLIKAMALLPKNFHLCLVGSGDDDRKLLFENMIKELGLTDRVHMLGLRTDVPSVLAASDYVVMCSHYEGLSLSSIEGMSSGKPFLASDVDGLHEIVDGYGVLFKHEDAKDFADAIIKLDSDLEYRNKIIKHCQEKAAKYDISVMVDKYLAVYEDELKKC